MTIDEARALIARRALVEVTSTGDITVHGDAVALLDGILILEDAACDYIGCPLDDVTSYEEITI